MHVPNVVELGLGMLFVAARIASAQPNLAPPQPVTPAAPAMRVTTCADGATSRLRFTTTFDATGWHVATPAGVRITDRDRVDVCVEHFNFLRFTLKFDITEQRSESYSYLTKLWGSILGPGLGQPLAAAQAAGPNDLLGNLQTLYRMARELDGAVAAAVKPYGKTGLTAGDAKTLAAVRGDENASPATGLAGMLNVTRGAFRVVDNLVLNDVKAFGEAHGSLRDAYRDVLEFYQAVDERAQIFLRLSARTIGVEIKQVGKRAAGTRVTLTLAAADESGATSPMDDVTYFVQSNMPLVAHGGLSFAGLKDVTFEKVKRSSTFGEEELFQRQTNANATTGFALFLGWQFYGAGDVTTDARAGRFGAAFSLGTDVTNPGKRVFAGPSAIVFNRAVLTGGVVFGSEASGDGATLEPNIFRIVSQKPKGSWFFSLSTRVY